MPSVRSLVKKNFLRVCQSRFMTIPTKNAATLPIDDIFLARLDRNYRLPYRWFMRSTMKFSPCSLTLIALLLFHANTFAADVELDVTMEVIDEDVSSSEEVMNIIELPAVQIRSEKERQQGNGEQTRTQGTIQSVGSGNGQQQTPQAGQGEQRPDSPPATQHPDAPPATQRPDAPPATERPDEAPAVVRPEPPVSPPRPETPTIPEQPTTPPAVERPVEPPAVQRPETPPTVERPAAPPAVERPSAPPAVERPVAPERPDTTVRSGVIDAQKDIQERARETKENTAPQKGK